MKTSKIAFVIDGYFGLTLYKHIKKTHGKVINFEGLVDSVCAALEKITDEKCISPANLRHYYMGTDSLQSDADRNEYEDALKLSRFGARGRPLQNGREKGIDTMLYSDIKDEANSGVFDYLVLLAGDLEHITLVQDLKAMKIRTILLYGEITTNGVKTTGCSYELRNSCFESVDLFELIDNGDIFQNAQNQTNSMTAFMKGASSLSNNKLTAKSSYTPTTSSGNTPALLSTVVSAIDKVIAEKEQAQGRKLAFAFQAQVGTQLKQNGVTLPMPLGEYLNSYPTVFKTGLHPTTKALTVSIR